MTAEIDGLSFANSQKTHVDGWSETFGLELLFAIVALATLAAKLDTPYPIVLVIGGLLLGFVPGMPRVPLNPELVFLIFLPPLLYAAAWNTSA